MPDWGPVGDFTGKLVDKAVDTVDRGIDKGKKVVGEGVDWTTDKVGGGLRHYGHDAVAEVVEDWGDETASSLGAAVGEKQLGQSEDPKDLIHGKADKITATVRNLRDFQRAYDLVGAGMRKLDPGGWKGEAAGAFREKFQPLPADWLRAADAFGDAADALDTYAAAVTGAQGKAREAIALYKEGRQQSEAAVTAYNKKVDAYNAARDGDDPLPRPGEFSDPGKGKLEQAQEVLTAARRARDEAAETAESAVTAAMAHAPKEPTGLEKLKLDFLDQNISLGVESTHLLGGVAKGTAGLVTFVRSLNPYDAYNVTHPAEYAKGVNTTLAGLVSTAANPDRALKNSWEAAKSDPLEFGGRLLPEAVGPKGLGVVRGGARTVVNSAGHVANVPSPRGRLPEGHAAEKPYTVQPSVETPFTGKSHPPLPDKVSPARAGVEEPHNPSRTEDSVVSKDSDPIDFASGAMYLPQTDVVLPGLLPLVFRRRVASDYRAGRWFGPSWSSTADERLEIDSEGIVHVREDGLLLAYPHPATGVPVLPSHGPRWPLDRSPDGDYTVLDPISGQVRRFSPHGEDQALLTRVDDRNGNWIAFDHDEAGAPVAIVHHGGYHLRLTTADGRVTALHLVGGAADGGDQELLRYGYTGGHLTEVVNSSGLPLRFAYDDRGRVTSWTDTNGSRYDYVYDERDRCIAEGGAAGHMALRVSYDGVDEETGYRVTTTTTPSGAVNRFVVNDSHQVVRIIDPVGAVTAFERDHRNRLVSETDSLGRTTRFDYDEAGRLLSATRPDGRSMTVEYDALGWPVRVTHPDRTVVRHSYDERGNRTATTDTSGNITHYSYDEAGRLRSVTDPLGHTTHVECDRAGLPLRLTDPLGATTLVDRDRFGRPTTLTDALGAVTRMEWTVEGRPARRVDADGAEQSWTYDGEGNCLAHTDALGQVSRFEYTHFDLLTARTGPDGVRYEFGHDHELRLTQVRNPQGLSWDYGYDAAGRLVSETDFDGRALVYERDAAGRLTSRTDALGQTTRYERDDLDRVIRKDAAGAVTTYAYDVFDQLAEAVNGDARVTRLRDRYGRLLGETVDGRVLSYTLDGLGRRTGRTTPTGAVSSWSHDATGRRSSYTASGRTLTFERDAAGRESARHIGDAVSLASTYDPLGRLTSQQVTGAGRAIQRRDYAYRADGHLTALTDQLTGTRTFDLDPVGRVTAVHAAGWSERYAYDAAGNQTHASWPASHPGQEAVGSRDYTGTALTRAGGVRYEHDGLGRVTLRQKTRLSRKPDTWRYTWDAEDRLRSVRTPDGTLWRYTYDPLGRRTSKQRMAADGTTVAERTTFTWDGTTLCEQTTVAAEVPRPVTLTWDHDGLRPLTQTERLLPADPSQEAVDERFFAIVTDLVGTPCELLDEAGDIAWRARGTLWGTTAWAADSTTYTPLRFPGQYFDPETGLHYNYFRHYDPEAATFLAPDPLGLAAAPNPTAYVVNPQAQVDPLGLAPCPPEGALSGAGTPMDSFLASGATVRHTETATAIGDDFNTLQNLLRSKGAAGHDVIVHGDDMGHFRVDGMITHPQQIADAILENPHYGGGPIQLVTCHGAIAAARELSEILGMEVRHASPHMVDLDPRTGLVREWPNGPRGNPIVK
ncbi:putative T7SS-secreted protein [Streptomyces sp. NPDC047097]|uniref:putative T7SS-secreted protein n=1 Tax=Streptomyces sp. NPDC047097 TaxID=3155260 RepID=UPI0033FAFB5A